MPKKPRKYAKKPKSIMLHPLTTPRIMSIIPGKPNNTNSSGAFSLYANPIQSIHSRELFFPFKHKSEIRSPNRHRLLALARPKKLSRNTGGQNRIQAKWWMEKFRPEYETNSSSARNRPAGSKQTRKTAANNDMWTSNLRESSSHKAHEKSSKHANKKRK